MTQSIKSALFTVFSAKDGGIHIAPIARPPPFAPTSRHDANRMIKN
jgi:hypothetical protein